MRNDKPEYGELMKEVKRQVKETFQKETLQIDHYAAHKSLNVNIDSFECKLW